MGLPFSSLLPLSIGFNSKRKGFAALGPFWTGFVAEATRMSQVLLHFIKLANVHEDVPTHSNFFFLFFFFLAKHMLQDLINIAKLQIRRGNRDNFHITP